MWDEEQFEEEHSEVESLFGGTGYADIPSFEDDINFLHNRNLVIAEPRAHDQVY